MRSSLSAGKGKVHSEDPPAGNRQPIARTRPSVVPITEFRGDFSVRRSVDEEHIHRLNQTEEDLPPILVHYSTLRVIDGVHRLRAATLRGKREIEVEFFYGDEDEAFIRAVAENTRHGLPLPLADRRAAATRIIAARPHWSDQAIGLCSGLSAKTVAALRRRSTGDSPESNTRTGVDGRTRPVNGADGRRRAAREIGLRPDASLREIARVAGVSLGTAHDVRRRLRRGEDPVPLGLRRAEEPARPRREEGKERGEAPRAPAAAGAVDPSSLLEGLTRDPSLRQSLQGRRLLQLLHTRSVTAADWSALVDAIPPHRVATIVAIAHQYAESWEHFARALENREGPPA
ncbi:ParB/RepB/Spo0J family partition protein [Actinomadura kijaniata]|uniref:ParB/RepB/Spo0J family partition protein n=1 Tax=Actinomadura kijaniata TaxID=46161 RepID=UPI000A079E3A|nr:ParB N-terminal domain-containing protein [Actinomadura kijaniata]